MPDELKLEPCPWCDSTHVEAFPAHAASYAPSVLCHACGRAVDAEDAVTAWNLLPRKLKWTTYDGTESTLPTLEEIVCAKLSHLSTIAWRRDFDGISYWMFQDGRRQMIVNRDRWTPWPEEE